MDSAQREALVERLALAFGDARDVTPADDQPAHILLPELDLPAPWTPSPTRALTIWTNWPQESPQFMVDEAVVGEGGDPPRSHHEVYAVGETWRGFSFTFAWAGDDPVRAVQMWMERFAVERS
jgi:hypothetical protein